MVKKQLATGTAALRTPRAPSVLNDPGNSNIQNSAGRTAARALPRTQLRSTSFGIPMDHKQTRFRIIKRNKQMGGKTRTETGRKNMKRIMTYGSRYGTTRRYAEKLSEITGIPLMNEADVGDLSSFGQIIHLGGLYAGGVKGLRKVVKHMPKGASLLVITVGLADVNNEVNTAKIKKDVKSQVPEDLWGRTQVAHLRGGIDYSGLSIVHKAMMAMLCLTLKATPEEERTAETQAMIDTYNQKVDFTDFSALDSIARTIMGS